MPTLRQILNDRRPSALPLQVSDALRAGGPLPDHPDLHRALAKLQAQGLAEPTEGGWRSLIGGPGPVVPLPRRRPRPRPRGPLWLVSLTDGEAEVAWLRRGRQHTTTVSRSTITDPKALLVLATLGAPVSSGNVREVLASLQEAAA